MDTKYQVYNVMEHLEAYHNGKFICSADNERELREELREYEKNPKDFRKNLSLFKPGDIVHPKDVVDMSNLNIGIMRRHELGKVIAVYEAIIGGYGCVVLCNNGILFKAHESEWERYISN